MEARYATLKVLLPFRVFSEVGRVTRLVAETAGGSFGILPNRLDCVAAVVPSIFEYETDEGQVLYLAVDEGILVKTGPLVRLSVRHAIQGDDLRTLKEAVEKEFKVLQTSEKDLRAAMTRMETGLIRTLKQFHD
ncbi:F0F1 ATP synthase subunit epsilon [Rhabdobacter roseus]|uniref:F-type H+-transporting ATPase subunit epsilon n=1 Tax=Rhabdobacter roseus TaxID=1655419 RepID=A0A840TQ34_9BACT|nr:F0F1 ATP synthase subunit epsilon [Rhabdobacter roseus]MBB5285015.1 F-type H+-transporting ATPase subunit epsilon [Rhabdobacter roseus]